MARAHQVLVVEDSDDIREAVNDICLSVGHEAVCVASQSDAEAMVTTRRFCYVLLDLEIPYHERSMSRIQTGLNTLDWLRERLPDLPVVVMTAHGRDHALCRKAFKQGATDFVKKPFDSEGEPPLEEVLKRAAHTGCERLHPGGCPEAEGGATAASGAATPARVYTTTIRVHLDGRCRRRCYLVLLDGQEVYLQYETFRILMLLAGALRRGQEYVRGRDLGGEYHKKISRARADLGKKTAIDPSMLIENDGHGSYRLSTAPGNVSFDEAALRTHHAELMKSAGW